MSLCCYMYVLRCTNQHAKEVMSDNLGLVDCAVGLVDSVLHLHGRQVKFPLGQFSGNANCRSTVKDEILGG